MCLIPQTDTVAPPTLPPETAKMRQPDAGTVSSAARRAQDRLRGGAKTILTSGSGVKTTAPTEKKTLLGQ